MISLRLLRRLRGRYLFTAPLASFCLLSLLVFALPAALLVGGCGGGKDKQAENDYYLSRLIMLRFHANVPQAEREALFQKYNLRVEGPFGDMHDGYLLYVREPSKVSETYAKVANEQVIRESLIAPIGSQ